MFQLLSMNPTFMKSLRRALLSGITLIMAIFVQAANAQTVDNDTMVRRAVEDFLRTQIQGLPGQASFTIDSIRAGNLPPCSHVDANLTPGARSWGRSSVSVRCVSGATWSLLVPVRIRVVGRYLVSARPLSPGQVVEAADLGTQTGDLGELPTGTLTDPDQAIGQVAKVSLPSGRPLRNDMLKVQLVVQQGQNVKVISRGRGFEVANDGRALSSAGVGQVVQVRLPGGQVVSGIAEAGGNVAINF